MHPIHNLYAASENSEIIHIAKYIKTIGNKHHTGYFMCNVKKNGIKQKSYMVYRFILGMF